MLTRSIQAKLTPVLPIAPTKGFPEGGQACHLGTFSQPLPCLLHHPFTIAVLFSVWEGMIGTLVISVAGSISFVLQVTFLMVGAPSGLATPAHCSPSFPCPCLPHTSLPHYCLSLLFALASVKLLPPLHPSLNALKMDFHPAKTPCLPASPDLFSNSDTHTHCLIPQGILPSCHWTLGASQVISSLLG